MFGSSFGFGAGFRAGDGRRLAGMTVVIPRAAAKAWRSGLAASGRMSGREAGDAQVLEADGGVGGAAGANTPAATVIVLVTVVTAMPMAG